MLAKFRTARDPDLVLDKLTVWVIDVGYDFPLSVILLFPDAHVLAVRCTGLAVLIDGLTDKVSGFICQVSGAGYLHSGGGPLECSR